MDLQQQGIYGFSNFRLETRERTLTEGNHTIQLPPKIFDTLLLLVENAGRVVSKESMLARIWEDSFVEENNLAQNISALRRVLRERNGKKFIETVPKLGYRFVAEVEEIDSQTIRTDIFRQTRAQLFLNKAKEGSQAQSTTTSILRPETYYVRNGNVNIAYQVVGDGPVDIVFVMGWVSHLEYFWKHHLFASFLEKLASFSRLILFDKRGTGLSDRVPINELPTLEQRMEDVHTVMDAVGSERAVLVGVSEGGPMCSLFAATYPDRTAGLVMIGTYAKRIWDQDYPWAPSEEQRQSFFDLMSREWGGPVGIEDRAPTMAADPEFRQWWAEYLRMGASPGAALALTKMNADIDVRPILPSIRVPSLIIHRAGDLCLKVEEGRFVASQIPNSQYVELDGIDHLPFVGDQDEIVDEIERFTRDLRESELHDRVLATVMSVRLDRQVSSSSREKITAKTPNFILRQLTSFRGREVFFGDGELLAVFDGPARAVRCAQSISRSAKQSGLAIRSGLHTGEYDVINQNYSGFAVELAKKIGAEAKPFDILVSRTVKDLVAGSGLEFEDFGTSTFQGIEGKWPIYKVR